MGDTLSSKSSIDQYLARFEVVSLVMARNSGELEPNEALQRAALGILALLIADRDERIEGSAPRRSDHVLSDAGFSAGEIATLTGRNAEAVRSSLRRRADTGKAGGPKS